MAGFATKPPARTGAVPAFGSFRHGERRERDSVQCDSGPIP